MIGLVIFGLILLPLVATAIMSVLTPPRAFKVAGMFTSVFIAQLIIMVVCFSVLCWIFSLIIP